MDGDPNALCQVAIDLTAARARERAIAAAKAAAAAELKQRLERQQRESNRKHNKDVRKQRKAARRRKWALGSTCSRLKLSEGSALSWG